MTNNDFQAVLNNIDPRDLISDTLGSVEGYGAGYGSMMQKLGLECIGYWLDVAQNNGTIEDVRELSEVFDHYNEEPNPALTEQAQLIGELWNYETDAEELSLDDHIAVWCSRVGWSARQAIEAYMSDIDWTVGAEY